MIWKFTKTINVFFLFLLFFLWFFFSLPLTLSPLNFVKTIHGRKRHFDLFHSISLFLFCFVFVFSISTHLYMFICHKGIPLKKTKICHSIKVLSFSSWGKRVYFCSLKQFPFVSILFPFSFWFPFCIILDL